MARPGDVERDELGGSSPSSDYTNQADNYSSHRPKTSDTKFHRPEVGCSKPTHSTMDHKLPPEECHVLFEAEEGTKHGNHTTMYLLVAKRSKKDPLATSSPQAGAMSCCSNLECP